MFCFQLVKLLFLDFQNWKIRQKEVGGTKHNSNSIGIQEWNNTVNMKIVKLYTLIIVMAI